MRFLADENIPTAAVAALAAAGHDIVWVKALAPGASDDEVLAWAARESRILLTFDKDFGELAAQSRLLADSGVVLFRLPMPRPAQVGARFVQLVESRRDWAGHFSVVEPSRIRMRRLPTP